MNRIDKDVYAGRLPLGRWPALFLASLISLCCVFTVNAQDNTDESDPPALQQAEQPLPVTPVEWLSRLSQTVSESNFQVSFVLTRTGQETTPYLWRHAVMDNGSEMEQLNLQNGPGRELIRIDDVVSVFEPDVPPYSLYSTVISGPLPGELLYHPEQLRSAYEFFMVGRARVSGRAAQQLRIVSKDNTRFSYQLWLDEQTGMLLKLNMLDLQGGLIEQIQVTELEILDKPHSYFARINQESLPKAMAITPRQARAQSWNVTYLPVGMEEISRDIRRLAITGQVVEYKMFSDGLVDVSVYVQPANEAVGTDLILRHSVNTFLTVTDGQVQITVIGEIPPKTANDIAHSLRMVRR